MRKRFRPFQLGRFVVFIGFDLLKSRLQPVNDFGMLEVEIVRLAEIYFHVVKLSRRITGLWSWPGLFAPEFMVAAITLTIDKLPLAGANRDGSRPAAGQNDWTRWMRKPLAEQSWQDVVAVWSSSVSSVKPSLSRVSRITPTDQSSS